MTTLSPPTTRNPSCCPCGAKWVFVNTGCTEITCANGHAYKWSDGWILAPTPKIYEMIRRRS